MAVHPLVIVALMTISDFGGGLALKQFSMTRDVLWSVAGFCAYGGSNVFFVLAIDTGGLARAMVFGSAAQIMLATTAGCWLGERISGLHLAAAVLACAAVLLTAISAERTEPPKGSPAQQAQEFRDV